MEEGSFKRLRKRFGRWRKTKRLRREFLEYQARFAAQGLAIPDDSSIRLALKNRFTGFRLKPKGALSIIAVYHNYNWEEGALKPALEKFGTVRRYDWFEAFDHTGRDWRSSGKAEMNRDLVVRIGQWVAAERPDVIFTYLSGEIVFPETVQALRSFNVPMIHFSLNDKEQFVGKVRGGLAVGSRDICRWFDLCWTSTEDALKKYCVEGALPVYLPEGANPELHRPWELEKTIDVSFVGQCYGNRPETIRSLREAGIRVEAFGHGWPNGPLSTEEMVRLYSKSRINLGFGGVEGHEETYCLKGRDFEIPMSGGLYLTEHHPELERVYDLGKEIVTYRGFDDLLANVRHLLADPQRAEAIRRAGFHRARKEHTWEMRFERFFSLMNLV
jgi:spore maturation protein CgeB